MATALPETAQSTLKKHAIGVPAIVFFVVAAAGPLAASVATAPVVFATAGSSAPLAYIIVGAVLLLFAMGYAVMSRFVTGAAGLAAYVEAASNRRVGTAAAFVAMTSYSAVLFGLYGGFGYFTGYVAETYLSVTAPWWLWSGIALCLVAVFGYLEINLSAKVLGVLMVCEVAIIVVFDAVVFVVGGPEGRSLAGLNPAALSDAPALGLGLLFAAVAFLGFEATAIYGEEAKDPARTIPRATYIAVGLITAFYTVTMLALSIAYGDSNVVAAAEANPAGFVLEANTQFVGTVATDIATALVVTSYFAAILALHNTLSRYVLSLGRNGALPAVLSRTHPRFQSPHIASVLGTVLSLAAVVIAVALGLDPFAQLFAWLTGLGTIGIFCLQAAASVAVVLFFRKDRRGTPVWNSAIAPSLAAIAITVIVYLAVSNWGILSGAVEGYAVYLPAVIPVAAVVGLVVAFVRGDALGSLQSPMAPDAPHHASQALISGLSPDESQADAP